MTTSDKLLEAFANKVMPKPKPKTRKASVITVAKAEAEVVEAFGICNEAATAMLLGLITTYHVRAFDETPEHVEPDECIASGLQSKSKFIAVDDLRDWLREWSAAPTAGRDRVISLKLRNVIPGRSIEWKTFCDQVRDECNGWKSKGKPALGFSDKQIQRVVKDLRQK